MSDAAHTNSAPESIEPDPADLAVLKQHRFQARETDDRDSIAAIARALRGTASTTHQESMESY